MAEARPDGCAFRTGTALVSSALMGAVMGALSATWSDTPKVLRNKAWPALVATGRVMGAHSITFAAVGGLYAAVDCLVEGARGKQDFWNGVAGGAAAGGVLGLRAGSLGVGVGASAALAATSAIIDSTGQKLRGDQGAFDDGATPPRTYYPYAAQAALKAKAQ